MDSFRPSLALRRPWLGWLDLAVFTLVLRHVRIQRPQDFEYQCYGNLHPRNNTAWHLQLAFFPLLSWLRNAKIKRELVARVPDGQKVCVATRLQLRRNPDLELSCRWFLLTDGNPSPNCPRFTSLHSLLRGRRRPRDQYVVPGERVEAWCSGTRRLEVASDTAAGARGDAFAVSLLPHKRV